MVVEISIGDIDEDLESGQFIFLIELLVLLEITDRVFLGNGFPVDADGFAEAKQIGIQK